jgi:hypothetical protein
LNGEKSDGFIPVRAVKNLKYVVPGKCRPGERMVFSFRPLIVTDGGVLRAVTGNGREIFCKTIPFVRPAEMLCVDVDVPGDAGEVLFELQTQEG